MSRRGSTPASSKKTSASSKRVSLKDGNLLGGAYRQSLGDIREGDTFYKTVRFYPSLSELPDDVTINVARATRETRAGSSAGGAESRRGSVLSHDESASPSLGRTESPIKERAASIAASAGGADSKRPRALIWPEWNEKDVNDEKWDVVQKAKKEDKGKSPVAQQHYFDDPEGKIELPSSLKVETWRRPNEFITEKTPVIVDPDGMAGFDLLSSNEHIHHSELMRYIISQVVALWENTTEKNVPPEQAEPNQPYEEMIHSWRPWEHIYALMKVQKPPFVTPYNAYGKYVVKLYWMGCWRKLIVDDAMPFDENDKLLLPATSMQHELWPMLLTKALIKVASLDYTGGSQSSEFGDCSIIQCLTGWIPEAIPLQGLMSSTSPIPPGPASGSGRASPLVTASQVLDKYIQLSSQPKSVDTAAMPHGKAHKVKSRVHKEFRHGHIAEVWDLLKSSLPEWKLPLQEWEKQLLAEQQEQEKKELDSATPHDMTKDNLSEKDGAKGEKAEKADPKAKDGKDKGKDAKDKGGKDKDKKGGDKDKGAKGAEKEKTMDDIPVPDNPEVVVFATYWSTPKYPVKVSVLGEMADASEKLRQNGLSHIYPHPVCITQTRSCPLEPPPPPEKIPAWKLIRPKKKKLAPSDEPVSTPEPPKPIQCLEVTSPFLNYKVSPVPIPTDTTRPRSSLSRGGTRSRPATGNINQIEETDENAPEPEPKKPEPEKEEPPKMEEPPQIVEPEVKPSTPSKEKRKSPTKTKEGNREASPKGKRASSAKGEKPKSAGRPDSKGKKEEEKPAKVESVSGEYETSPPATPPAAAQPPPPSDGGGFAPPPPTDPDAVPLEGGEEGAEKPPEPQEEQVINEEAAKAKKVWMDFDMFCKCFKTLYIYHKPHTYKYNHKHADLKKLEKIYNIQSVTQAAAPVGKGDKKGGQGNVGAGGTIADERAPHYLFVDNLKPTEIVVCFSALSRWHDPPPQGIEEAKSHVNLKGKKGEQEKELTTVTSSSVMEEEPPDIKVDQDHSMEGSIVGESKPPPVVTPGTLVAEPYSWKSLVTGQPILRIRSTATKAAVLNLPAGRHVLRFMMSGPLGYSVHLVSTVPFVFGNEEEVMPELTKESCRFVDNALQVINSIGKCINTFTDTESFKKNWEELVHYHCPYRNDKLMSKQHHFEVFNDALYNMLRKCLSDVATPDIAFAWRCFTFDSTTKNILGLPTSSRPGTATTSHRGSAKPPGGGKDKEKEKDKGKQQQQQQTQHDGETEKVENPWANREPTPFEHTSAVKIQKNWKAFYVRKITQARVQGSEENTKVAENLQKCWNIIDPNAEQNGLFLFRFMFKNDPDIMVKYPFYQDEWNKISYADYSGTYTDQPPNNWFLVFREIFYVNEEMLAVPKLYVPVNTCLLRVVNNDNGEEIPRVFQKVAPYVYKKNKKGYSFVAEARTTDQGIPSNKWRMRLIGSLSPLPAPAKPDTVNSSFVVKHITDYYVPNSKDVIFRYTVKVTEDHLATVQINTSKLDVYIKLVILDNETEVATTQGKGHAVIPSFIFLKDFDPNEEKRPSSRASVKETKGKGGSKESVGKKRSGSGKSPEGRTSRPGSRHSDASEVDLEEKDYKPHKYIIQAMVLKNSWPLSESSWAFVQMLKDLEKNELKVANKERPPSPPKQEKTAASTSSKDKGKGGAKGKDKGKDKDQKGSRPSSQQFDHSKPHWNLRIASDASGADDIEVKKDTERADEIRALKRAWENAEEGRAVKAMQSRLKYLNMHTIKQDYDKEETEGGEEKPLDQEEVPPQTPLSLHGDQGDENLTLEPPPAPTPTEMLQQMDFSPFLKKPEREPRYLDDEEIRRREEEQKRQVEEYKAFRDQVKAWREQDKQKRNVTKIRQLEECEELQAMLDAARESVNAPREAIRQKYLEAERKKQEELEAKEAASLSDQTSKSPKGRKSAKGKKSPANGKKKGK